MRAPEGEGTSPVLITETHAGPPRRIISLMHSRAHNFQIKLSGLRLGDHGNRTSVHNGRNCWERRCVLAFLVSLYEPVEPGAWLASGASQSLTRQLFIRGGHRRPFSPTFSSLNINYILLKVAPAQAASRSGTREPASSYLSITARDSHRRLSWQLGNNTGNDRSRKSTNGQLYVNNVANNTVTKK